MRAKCFVYKARVIVETRSPTVIPAGRKVKGIAGDIFRDVSGLPLLPGTALAGVIRNEAYVVYGKEWVEELFGGEDEDHIRPSKIRFTMAHSLSSHCKVQEGFFVDRSDPVLTLLLQDQAVFRERVNMNHRGGTKQSQRIELGAIPRGARFCFELTLMDSQNRDQEWQDLLQLLTCQQWRMGAYSRAGYGAISVHSISQGRYLLHEKIDVERYRKYPHSLSKDVELDSYPCHSLFSPLAKVTLNMEAGIKMGASRNKLGQSNNSRRSSLVYLEKMVDWETGVGKVKDMIVVPASSIKGALAHRMEFHYRCLSSLYVNESVSHEDLKSNDFNRHQELADLLGKASKRGFEEEQGSAGELIIDDCYLNPATVKLHKRVLAGIDRYTAATRKAATISEEIIWKPTLNFNIYIRESVQEKLSPLVWKAMKITLDDLITARLPIGAGAGAGFGFGVGTLTWYKNNGYC